MLPIIFHFLFIWSFNKTNKNETTINNSNSFESGKEKKLNHDESNIEPKYINPVSPPGIKSKLCYRLIIGIASATFLFYLIWMINWILNFSMKNAIHLLLTLSFTLFTIENIIYVFDYSANNLSEKKNQKLAIAHYIFMGLSNFLFLLSISLYIHGYGVYYERPRIWIFFSCIIVSALGGLCTIINHVAFPTVVYYIFLINFSLFYCFKKEQSDDSKDLQVFVLVVFFIYQLFYFITLMCYAGIKDKKEKNLKTYLIIRIFELLLIIIIGFGLRMTKDTKNNYMFFYMYSIYNIDREYKTRNNNGPVLLDIKNNVFQSSPFSKFTILSNVVKIGDYSFSYSHNLRTIEFSYQGNLKIIGKNAFNSCPIKKLTIPSSVNEIGGYAFSNCKELESIDFENNSQLTSIKSNTFFKSSIKSLEIPAKIENLIDGWCCETPKLVNISLSLYNIHFILYENNVILGKQCLSRENYETLCFAKRNIDKISIPSYITSISPYAFENCKLLKKVVFESNSKLKIIKKNTFSNSGIYTIKIPYSVYKIEENAFQNAFNLRNIIFFKNSNLKIIGKKAFWNSGIKSICFPANVTKIEESAFSNCTKLNSIDFENDSKLRIIDNCAFSNTAITSISIPPSVVDIKNNAFKECGKLVCIEITEKSELCSIQFCRLINNKALTLFIPHHLLRSLKNL